MSLAGVFLVIFEGLESGGRAGCALVVYWGGSNELRGVAPVGTRISAIY